jgi:hypothetical protein
MGRPAPPPSIPVASLTIAPPDGVRIANPGALNANIPVNYGAQPSSQTVSNSSGVSVVFAIQSGGNDCGQYLAGQPQELLTNKVAFGKSVPPDTGYTPPGFDARFFLGAPDIYDFKVTNPTASYLSWTSGTIYYTATQSIRLLQTDPCGNVRTYGLGTVNWQREKIDNNNWQLQRP